MGNRNYADQREQIMYDWFEKGQHEFNKSNDFEAFIYLWISWVVACKIHLANNKSYESIVQKDLDDRKIILEWSKNNSSEVVECINLNSKDLVYLGNRVGSYYSNPIIDSSKNLQEKFTRLKDFFSNKYLYENEKDLAEDFTELLNKIRNNLFHGNKSYDNHEDKSLLKAILPVLKDITQIAVKTIH
jgi:hypothetical protein